ncbi:hypothetical protein RJT34_16015 [Clitoria ternatea]|uniref:Uncharacterized protein n=1 Tax=Clitoria ternatea TaxID=43366 RepID=A0AAN9J9F8_CLITE
MRETRVGDRPICLLPLVQVEESQLKLKLKFILIESSLQILPLPWMKDEYVCVIPRSNQHNLVIFKDQIMLNSINEASLISQNRKEKALY